MVYANNRKYIAPDPAYDNDVWRARHGYKELDVHDPPYRRNRDFRPVPFGSFKGMPNFKHAEPWCLLKNLKDIPNENHNFFIRWTKAFLYGAFVTFHL